MSLQPLTKNMCPPRLRCDDVSLMLFVWVLKEDCSIFRELPPPGLNELCNYLVFVFCKKKPKEHAVLLQNESLAVHCVL